MISELATVTKLSPNHSGKRNHEIDRITYHCFVGQVTANRGLEVFLPKSRRASANYVIGYDGSIGACVDEDNRSWCSSSEANDQRAITIEIASGTVEPYEIRDAAYDAAKKLTIDIMRRNGKSHLVYIPQKNKALAYQPMPHEMVITQHRWFAAKACPGSYIISVLQDLSDAANRELATDDILYKPLYRVQVGAFRNKANAGRMLDMLPEDGYINYTDGLYRVQVGAYAIRQNAEAMRERLVKLGFDAYIKEEDQRYEIYGKGVIK